MRTGIVLFAASLLLGSVSSASSAAYAGDTAPQPQPKLEFVYVEMTGVAEAEVPAVMQALGKIEGVQSFAWTVAGSEAKVIRVVGTAQDDALVKAAKGAGAESAGIIPLAATTFVFSEKLHCGGCVGTVNKALLGIKGVKESIVSAEMTQVIAVYDTRSVKPTDVESVLASIGKAGRAAR